jgi:hypothetical protein
MSHSARYNRAIFRFSSGHEIPPMRELAFGAAALIALAVGPAGAAEVETVPRLRITTPRLYLNSCG